MKEIRELLEKAVKTAFDLDVEVELTRPEEQFGDFATNVALQISKDAGANPREVAEKILAALPSSPSIAKTDIAGPGFINIHLSDKALIDGVKAGLSQTYSGKEILVEFGDPNPLKAMHLGHLYTTIVGDSIASLFEAAGGRVKRLSYHGDVGLHIAKAVWAIGETIGWDPKRLGELEKDKIEIDGNTLNIKTVVGFLYAKGATAFDDTKEASDKIKEINEHVYKKDDPTINAIYEWGVERSFGYFDLIFDELGVKFDKRYLESETFEVGIKSVKQHTPKVFEESDGAIVFRGEKADLHTRVFITSQGLPTYEAKDLGLAQLKAKDFPQASRSVVITANEQTEYFRVMLAALGEFAPQIASKMTHLAHGFLSLTSGKMSSRTGKVYGAQTLMDDTLAAIKSAYPDSKVQRDTYLAALKYAFLKHRVGGDIVFDVDESISLDGNSGPYIQYAHARARSILAKTTKRPAQPDDLQPAERSLARKIGEYPEVIDKSVNELMPHNICTYLYELAQTFNRFYEQNRIIGDEREAQRLGLIDAYAEVLNEGLNLLGIPAPKHM